MKLYLLLMTSVCSVTGQASQWIDSFQKTMCHDRWSQMDWQSILRPCRYNMAFGANKFEEKLRTSPKWSHTLGLHFKKTGEFSKIAIQSRTSEGRNKIVGGDTWRVFIRGADRLTPFVTDLDNGVYEAKFIALQAGFYKAEIAIESSLCEALKDPPQDWLKRDASTILGDEKNEKLLWEPLRGGNISFKIENAPESAFEDLKRNLFRYKDSCGMQYKCDLLWNGFGRWVNSTWMPYVDDNEIRSDDEEDELDERCLKKKEGVLKMTGDDLTQQLFKQSSSHPLCKSVFKKCFGVEVGEQPDLFTHSKRDVNPKTFSTSSYLRKLKQLLKKDYMDEKSGLVLNYGHPFVQNIGFKQYRSFIDRAVKIVKAKYKGKPIWRTMASDWRESGHPEDRFKNHQRIRLFNAYATSAMCNAGIPVLDVFQMSESAPPGDKQAVARNIESIITKYYKQRPIKQCKKKHKIKLARTRQTFPSAQNVTSNNMENSTVSSAPSNATVASLFSTV